MNKQTFKLTFLPLFEEDLLKVTDYITNTSKIRNYPYYRINVRNFSIFYVVIDDTMEVRRLLYSKRNIDELLK